MCRPKLGTRCGFIEEILRSDLKAPRKQRRTVRRIFERLRAAHGLDGGGTTALDCVRSLTGAKRRVGGVAASRRALATASSVLPRFQRAFAQAGGMMRP